MKNSRKKLSIIYMVFILSFNLFIPSAFAADDSFKTMYVRVLNYIDIVSVQNYLYKYQNVALGIALLIFFLVLFGFSHLFKSKRLKLAREKQAALEELLSYLCLTYEKIEKIDVENNVVSSFALEQGELEVKTNKLKDIDLLMKNFHPEDVAGLENITVKNIVDRVMKTCAQEELIVREKDAKGNYQWVSYLFKGVRSDKQYRRNCLLLKRNINELKSKELKQREQLQNALIMAQQSAAAKGNFMSHMSHEIRTPLNTIVGYLNLAKEEDSKENLQSFLAKSDVAAKNLVSVVNDILDMSDIESGKMKINNSLFDFKQTIAAIGKNFYEQAKEKDVAFEIILTDVDEDFVIGDKFRLNQILVNLLANAIKFTSSGGTVTFSVKQMAIHNKKVFMHFEVSDTGKGISPDFMKNIFTPFEQESSEIAVTYGGSGLGLSITNNLVKMLNGAITVESEEDKGSVFNVELPFEFDPEHHKNMGEKRDFSFVKAIIVDDQENSARYIEQLLNKFGVATTIANSGEKALKYITESSEEGHPFQLCFMDWQMPEMNGLETAKKILELKIPAIKIVLVTGYNYSEILEEAKALGIGSVITKPVFNSSIFDLLLSSFGNKLLETETGDISYDFKGKNILLAEDNNINADIVSRLLEKMNLKVDRAINGQEVCEMFGKAESGHYGAILMDIQMPEIDGYEATKLIRMSDHTDAKTIPVLAMTANVLSEDVAKALACGMNGHIGKPIDTKNLYHVLEKFMK